MYKAVVAVLLCVEHSVFDKHRDSPQDERHKEVHVDKVPGAVKLPVGNTK